MDVQILNEIAALARKAPPPQVGAPVSGKAQLKALKGSPVPPPGNPAPPPFEALPESGQGPVTPDISSVARAASAYSAAVNNDLNPDEINAIQDLAGQIRSPIADFLNQPGLDQAENPEALAAAHPEAVQDLQAGLEQAIVETFSAPALVDDGIVPPDGPHEPTPVTGASLEIPISEERVTHGAEPNPAVPAIAGNPALQNAQAREPANVDSPVTVEEPPETSSRDFTVGNFTVSPASPAVPDSNSRPSRVEEPVAVEGGPEISKGDFTGIATSPALVNLQPVEEAQVENPVSRPETAVPQQTPQSQPGTVATTQQGTPVTAASPALQNAQAGESANVETPVSRPERVSTNSQQTSASQPVRVVAADQEAPVAAPSTHGLRELISDSAAVNPENVRDVNALVNSVVENEFTAEAKKIFSEPKGIRTVADLADFILERLREIMLTKQLQ